MHLISLVMENFRQHKDTRIDFSDGITIINGANGSGKSTILEAISWAIYGIEAARGNKDTIRCNKSDKKAKVKVELTFMLDNDVYKVVRWLDKVEVYHNENPVPIVFTQQEVTKYLVGKLGMTRDEFFNTYFTGQKELNFLGNQKTAERRKFISKVLNYEKVKEAQERVRIDKNNINNEINGIKQGLGDIEQLQQEKQHLKEKKGQVEEDLKVKEAELNKCKIELGELLPVWTKAKTTREDFNKFDTELKYTVDKLNNLEKTIVNLTAESKELEAKSRRLEELKPKIDEYKSMETRIQELEKLQKHEFERQKFLTQLESINKEIALNESRIKEVLDSAELNKNVPAQIPELKEEIEKLKELIQEETKNWTANKQEIKTLLKQKENELEKVANQHSMILQKGEDGACPTCNRPLKNEFANVIDGFKETIGLLSREIQELVNQEVTLDEEPVIISNGKKTLLLKEKEFEELNKQQGQFEEKIKFYEGIKAQIAKKKEERAKIEEALGKIPQGFDREMLEKLRAEFNALKAVYDEVLGLNAQLQNINKTKEALESTIKEKQKLENRKKELTVKLSELSYSEEDYKKLEERVNKSQEASNQAQYAFIKTEGEHKEVNALLNKLLEAEKQYKEKLELVKSKQEEWNYRLELDRFYGQFLENLNNQARPELSEYASRFLTELTDGRYSTLELNEKYDVCLYDDGEIKPVISGGEEDIANLCLRLAISQMIAQRSGRALSLLILDEVFGSLDESRRNNVIQLLYSLTNSFEQVILITHIEDIKENIDNIIRIDYDEEQGCSIVSQSNNITSLDDYEDSNTLALKL